MEFIGLALLGLLVVLLARRGVRVRRAAEKAAAPVAWPDGVVDHRDPDGGRSYGGF